MGGCFTGGHVTDGDEHERAKASHWHNGTACNLDWYGVGDHQLFPGLGDANWVAH